MSTLAYVVTECRGDAEGGTIRQQLEIRQGDKAPIIVAEHSAAGFANARRLCRTAGVVRQATYGTNPYGSQVFAIDQNGTGLRQLTTARGFTQDANGAVTVELAFPFAHPGQSP